MVDGGGVDDGVARPVPHALRYGEAEGGDGGGAQRRHAQAAAQQGGNAPLVCAAAFADAPGLPDVFRRPLCQIVVFAAQPEEAAAAAVVCGEPQYGVLSRKHFLRHGDVDLQGEELAQVEQHADHQKTKQPEGGDVGKVDLIVDADQPQQADDGEQADARPRRAAADGGEGGRAADGGRLNGFTERPHG